MAEKMATFAWYGITLRAPEEWSLVAAGGNEKKGNFRVDSPISSAVEVRWSQALGKKPELMARGREFLSALEKEHKKKKVQFSSKIRESKDDGNRVDFSWIGSGSGHGRLIYCPECDRVMIAQVVSTRDENVSHLSPVILGSIHDHREDGLVNWALYGVELALPAGYKPEKQTLMSGYLSLTFKEKAKRLVVQRWGLAKTILEDGSLEEWYKKQVLVDIKGYKLEASSEEIKGHEGLVVKGRRSGIKQLLKSALYSLTLYQFPSDVSGYAWHCPESNRIYSFYATHPKSDDLTDQLLNRMSCQEEHDNK